MDQTDTECPVCREDYSLCEAEVASAVPSSDDMAVKAIIEQMEALPNRGQYL